MIWEYTSVEANSANRHKLLNKLNELGTLGWQVVGFASADKTIGLNSIIAICGRQRSVLTPAPAFTAEGWLPDPSGRHPNRYWDGNAWTKWVAKPGGKRTEDLPYADALSAAPSDDQV